MPVTHDDSLDCEGGVLAGSRDPGQIDVKRTGRLVATPSAVVPYAVTDEDGAEIGVAAEYLRHVTAGDFSGLSVRSYGLALLRWLRFLRAVGVEWDRAGQAEVADFVLWMRSAPAGRSHRPGAPVPGSVNPRTGKRYLGERFAPATINHNLAVIRSFYEFHIGQGAGPVRNPVPARPGSRGRGRADAHHNPLEPFRPGKRGAYRQRVPQTAPRAIPDGLFDELFTAMGCDRDRAIVALYVSTGARPSELLGMRGGDIDYGGQMVAVTRKGTRAVQWLPGSPDSFVWLRIYQNSLPEELAGADRPVWWTRRRPWRALDYDAMRAVLRRVNDSLGTNWTLHDLRHTCAVRMANDPKMPLVTVQMLLGHAHLSSTEKYLRPHLEQIVAHARQHHQRQAAPPPPQPDPGRALGYDAADLNELFGWQARPGEQR